MLGSGENRFEPRAVRLKRGVWNEYSSDGTLELRSFDGVGDRFAHQAKAQLAACMRLRTRALRSFRCGTSRTASTPSSAPSRCRRATRRTRLLKEMGWSKPFFLDADHINMKTVQRFLDPWTSYPGCCGHDRPAGQPEDVARSSRRTRADGTVTIPTSMSVPHRQGLRRGRCRQVLAAVQNAGEIYSFLIGTRARPLRPEISMTRRTCRRRRWSC